MAASYLPQAKPPKQCSHHCHVHHLSIVFPGSISWPQRGAVATRACRYGNLLSCTVLSARLSSAQRTTMFGIVPKYLRRERCDYQRRNVAMPRGNLPLLRLSFYRGTPPQFPGSNTTIIFLFFFCIRHRLRCERNNRSLFLSKETKAGKICAVFVRLYPPRKSTARLISGFESSLSVATSSRAALITGFAQRKIAPAIAPRNESLQECCVRCHSYEIAALSRVGIPQRAKTFRK